MTWRLSTCTIAPRKCTGASLRPSRCSTNLQSSHIVKRSLRAGEESHGLSSLANHCAAAIAMKGDREKCLEERAHCLRGFFDRGKRVWPVNLVDIDERAQSAFGDCLADDFF